MVNYPLADFLIQLKNAFAVGKRTVVLPHSKQKEAVARLLVKKGFLAQIKVKKEKGKTFSLLEAYLPEKKDRFSWAVKLFSKPGRRYYVGAKEIPYPRDKGALVIISTPKGIVSGRQARKENMGGELIAHLW